MVDLPLLSLVTFLPLVGAAFIITVRGEPDVVARNARNVALLTSLTTFVLSLGIWFELRSGQRRLPAGRAGAVDARLQHLVPHGRRRHLGDVRDVVDAADPRSASSPAGTRIQQRVKEYMVAFLFMETMLVGTFCALDLVLFYVFFEGVLIPMFLIIGIWGGPRRVYSAFKFFLYTLIGSVLMLIALLTIYFTRRHHRHPGCCSPTTFRSSCRTGCGSPSSPRLPSSCRCGRCTPGCRTRTSRHRPPARSSSPASC